MSTQITPENALEIARLAVEFYKASTAKLLAEVAYEQASIGKTVPYEHPLMTAVQSAARAADDAEMTLFRAIKARQ